ncbi:MAG: hypothetical protein FWG64_04000, partial [Firmicutes bacterium]|nr:hypothetical protein [Bacillota bacterium]
MKKSLSLKIARIVPLSVTSIGMLASSVAPALAAEMPPPNVNTTEYADSLTDAFFVEVNAPNFADKQVYENEALDFIQLNIGIKDTAFADVALKGYTILHNHIIVAEGLFDDDSDDVHEIATTPSYAETSSSGEYTVMITYEVDGRKHVYNYGTVNLNVTSNQERVETEIHDGWQQAFSSMTQTRQQPTRVASQNAPVAAAVQATQVAQTSSGLTNAIMTQVLTKMAGNPLNNTQVQILSNSTEFFLQQSGRNNLTDVQLGLVTSLFSETLAKSATEPLSASRIYDYSQTLADLTTDLLNQTQALDTAQSVVLGQLLGNATAPFNDQSLPIDTVDFLIGTLEELNFSNLSDSQTQIVTRILSNTIMQNSIRTSSNGELDTIRQNLLLALDEIVPSIPDNLTQAQISAISSNLNRSFRPVVDSIAQLLANGQMSQAHSNVLVQSLVSSARASIASVMNVRSPRRTIPPRGNNSRNGQQSETVSEGNGNVANNPTETPADNPTNNRPINPPLDPSARPPITTPDNDLPTVTPPISDIEPPIDVLPPRPPATTPDNEMPTVDSDDIPTVDPDNELPTVEPPILDTDNELATVNPDDIPTVDPDSELPTVNPGDIPPLDRPPVRPPFVPDNELPEVDLPTIDPDNDLLIVRPPFIKPDNELPTVDLPTIDPDNDLPIVRPPFIKPDNELPTVDLPTIDPDNELPIVRPPFIKPDNELPTVDLPTIDPDNDLPIVRPPRPPITPENELPEVELPT